MLSARFAARPLLLAGTLALVLSAVFLVGAPPEPAAAQTTSVKLVGNTGASTTEFIHFGNDIAQPFVTGDHSSSYTLTHVDMKIKSSAIHSPRYNVYIRTNHLTENRPLTLVAILSNPASLTSDYVLRRWSASGAGIVLDPNTTYWVVVDVVNGAANTRLVALESDAEDSGAQSGWSIGNGSRYRDKDSSVWGSTTSSNSVQIAVHGYMNESVAPVWQSATVDGTTLTLHYDELLDKVSTPDTTDFMVKGAGPDQEPTNVAVSGAAVTLTLGTAAADGQTVTVSYTAGSNPIQDIARNSADDLDGQSVTNATGGPKPTVRSVVVASTPTVDANSDGTADTYGLGEKIRVRVTFSAPVTVTGTPRLQIGFGPDNNKWAEYEGGSDTTELTFVYTVAAGDTSTAGVGVVANTLEPHVGTIVSTGKPVAATLAHAAVANNAAHKVDAAQTPTAAPGGAPTGVSVSAGTNSGQLSVSWTAPSGTIAHYELRYYAGSSDPSVAADWVEGTESTGLPQPTSTSGTIKGLKSSTQYRVQVRAVNLGGVGPWSGSASATTGSSVPATNRPPKAETANTCQIIEVPALLGSADAFRGRLGGIGVFRGSRTCESFGLIGLIDQDGDELTLTITGVSPSQTSVNQVGYFVEPTVSSIRVRMSGVSAHRSRTVTVSFDVVDSHGASAATSVQFHITSFASTAAPHFEETVSNQFIAANEAFSMVLPRATGGDLTFKRDSSSDVVTFPYHYAVSGLPPGLTFDPATRRISGKPTETGAFSVTYTADDADSSSADLNPAASDPGDTASRSFVIRVGAPAIELVRIVSAPTYDADDDGVRETYVRGDKILVDVEYSEPVRVTGTGDVRLRLDLGTDDSTPSNSRKLLQNPTVLHNGDTLRFTYTVQSSDTDTDGLWVQKNASNEVVFQPIAQTEVVSALSGVGASRSLSGLPTTGDSRHKVDGSKTASDIGPRPRSAVVNGDTLWVEFNQNLDRSVDPTELPAHFSVRDIGSFDGGSRNVDQHPQSVKLYPGDLRKYIEMKLVVPPRGGDRVRLTYHLRDRVGPLKGADTTDDSGNTVPGKMAPAFVGLVVTNNTRGASGPLPLSASVTGTALQLIFDRELDAESTPAGTSFLVDTTDADGDRRAIRGTGTATVSGTKVSVTLATPLRVDELADVSYVKQASAPLQSVDGIDVLSFDRFHIKLVYDGIRPKAIGAAIMQTQTSPNKTKAVLYFDEALDPDSVPAAGDFVLSGDTTSFTFPTPSVAIVGSTVVLTLDMAMPPAKGVNLWYEPGTNPVRDLAGNAAGRSGKQAIVSQSSGTPVLRARQVNGVELALLFDRGLDPSVGTDPATFTVHHPLTDGETDADLREYGRIVSFVVRANVVALELEHPVYPCDGDYPFIATYTKPTETNTPKLTGLAGDEVAGFAKLLVSSVRSSDCLDTPPPIAESEQSGVPKSMMLQFQHPLDTAKSLKSSAFTLKSQSGGSAPVVQGAAYTPDASGVALTLDRALDREEKATVSYSRAAKDPGLWDAEGRQVADFSEVPVVVVKAPAVTGIEVVSDAGGDATYALGAEILVRVTFDEAVEVTGSPRLQIDMDPDHWGQKWAVYRSGSGSADLVFAHEVVKPNESTQGIAVLANTLELNGGGLAAASGSVHLSHGGLGHDPDHKVNWRPNSPATGAPTITGTPQVGETLTADTSGIADGDGFDSASFRYQWLVDDADISGATGSTYTLAEVDEGRTVKVRLSFTDDAGNDETLTSAATDAVAGLPPLAVSLENAATSHNGTDPFTFELRFSEEVRLSYKTLRDHSLTVTDGTVTKAKRQEQGSNIHWRITVEPDSDADVTIVLPVTTDCNVQGAICTKEGGRPLSDRLEFTVAGP